MWKKLLFIGFIWENACYLIELLVKWICAYTRNKFDVFVISIELLVKWICAYTAKHKIPKNILIELLVNEFVLILS